jgi:alanyl-tRNA synthetase
VEDEVNKKITRALPVNKIETTFEEAKKMGAQAVFERRYEDKVSVYIINDYSIEVCSGPHVDNTGELGLFRIIKEEGISSGVRRIRAILEY